MNDSIVFMIILSTFAFLVFTADKCSTDACYSRCDKNSQLVECMKACKE